MSVIELFLVAVGLSMDAFAVALSDGLTLKRRRSALVIALFFGIFQAGMPMIGYFLGTGFSHLISAYDHFSALAVLGFIGGKMIFESISELKCSRKNIEETPRPQKALTFPLLIAKSAATSIDALVVGVTLSAMGQNIFFSAALIGITTFVISLAGALWGKRFGTLIGTKAELVGGVVLLAIGIKTCIEPIFFGCG